MSHVIGQSDNRPVHVVLEQDTALLESNRSGSGTQGTGSLTCKPDSRFTPVNPAISSPIGSIPAKFQKNSTGRKWRRLWGYYGVMKGNSGAISEAMPRG